MNMALRLLLPCFFVISVLHLNAQEAPLSFTFTKLSGKEKTLTSDQVVGFRTISDDLIRGEVVSMGEERVWIRETNGDQVLDNEISWDQLASLVYCNKTGRKACKRFATKKGSLVWPSLVLTGAGTVVFFAGSPVSGIPIIGGGLFMLTYRLIFNKPKKLELDKWSLKS